ncbi:response regulator transcription factor [Carnobacterium sp. ISL-102]|uniref:response regulator transcription factor n=1 Tax=Carnobacterium sp. ISL-102 TaxID=2819142 RepID=UPI001BE78397|nr:response regulator transcription factor [Carnobacterium sp. ISL-102]MBT2732513.1 response regulator transcription factor [Carnobacterium sp. ISL-102]
MNILMIEDNQSVCEMMEMFFMKEEWKATFIQDGKVGLDTFKNDPEKWDLVTLDLNLPSMDGMQICREMRKVSKTIPIIMLTAKDSESDQVIGLEMGADDYVTKPFSPLTLIARIKALYRRADLINDGADELEGKAYEVETRYLKMDKRTREAILYDKPIEGLTPKEFELLYTLAKSPRQVFSREQLLTIVWDYEYFGDERTVDAHIKKLRQKIDKTGPQVVQTVWGVGYKYDDSGVTL